MKGHGVYFGGAGKNKRSMREEAGKGLRALVSRTSGATLSSLDFTLRVGQLKGKRDQPLCVFERPFWRESWEIEDGHQGDQLNCPWTHGWWNWGRGKCPNWQGAWRDGNGQKMC